MKVYAPAKVNLYLRVLAKRSDGYHDIETIMQTISLYDTLVFSKSKDSQIKLICNNPLLPVDEGNLIYKAVQILKKYTNYKKGIDIYLKKRIPIAAGLGGGSSDAAATLMTLNELWKVNLKKEELKKLGAKLGADVPFFIEKGTVLATGIGDKLTPLEPIPKTWMVLLYPKIEISTKWVYNKVKFKLTKNDFDINIISKNYKYRLASILFNSLEEIILKHYPLIDDIKKEFMDVGALGALMSGSGSCVFGIASNKEKAKIIYNYFKSSDYPVWLARTI
ncbi:MAG: 4-(cytidine 5'-diphospho)-2-C-methyl-D-erythritol kinase [bacterium]|nr:4-(cytidine 5'-diphospho)-2-C-methyl-D-erythritol kinase [bacterium]